MSRSNAEKRGLRITMEKSALAYNPQAYNISLAEALKQLPEIEAPEWVLFVKSGVSRRRPIEDPDFWYKRAASIMRQIYKRGVVGTNRLRTRYGGRQNRGFTPEIFRKSSGKIIRLILQQLDAAGLTEVRKARGVKCGRILTAKGKDFMDSLSVQELKAEEASDGN